MKTTLFAYENPAGTFWIRPEPAGRVQLGIDRHKLPYAEWDEGTSVVPPDLDRWKRP